MNPELDVFFSKTGKWQDCFAALRSIVLSCGLEEELKWGHPCYTFQKANVVLIHGFKNYCALLFMKGALLNDPDSILVQQTANVQAARQIRFVHIEEVLALETVLKTTISQAIAIEKQGLKVKFKETEAFKVPAELETMMKENPRLKVAFDLLSPGRQRNYLHYFSSPKRTKTRLARIEKCMPKILNGLGLQDHDKK